MGCGVLSCREKPRDIDPHLRHLPPGPSSLKEAGGITGGETHCPLNSDWAPYVQLDCREPQAELVTALPRHPPWTQPVTFVCRGSLL